MNHSIQFRTHTLTVSEAASLLRKKAEEGLRQRLGSLPPQYLQRLTCELDQLEAQEGLLQQLLILWDLAEQAEHHSIFTAPGNPGLARSVTAFGLKLTCLDPIVYGLSYISLAHLWRKYPKDFLLPVPGRAVFPLSTYLRFFYKDIDKDAFIYEDLAISRIDYVQRAVEARTGTKPVLPAACSQDSVYDFIASDGPLTFCIFHQGSTILKKLRPRNLLELTNAGAFQAMAFVPEEDPDLDRSCEVYLE